MKITQIDDGVFVLEVDNFDRTRLHKLAVEWGVEIKNALRSILFARLAEVNMMDSYCTPPTNPVKIGIELLAGDKDEE